MYYLKLFDEDLISFNMENKFGLAITDIKVLSNKFNIFPIKLKEEVNEETIKSFISSRIIPKNRAFVQTILQSVGISINDKKAIIDISKGLSLTDSYWIVEDRNLKFEDYNLFENDFSKIISLIAFTGYSSKIKELSTSPEFSTNGMLPKAWKKLNGEIYLYKGSTEMYHYANTGFEPYSEYYASQIASKMEIEHIDYDLKKWKKLLASTCKLFTNKNTSYVQIGDIVTKGGIKQVYNYLKEQSLQNKFSDMILLDAITINPDRHFGNFGVLRDNKTGKIIDFAPIFDNGESMLSKAMPNIFNNFEEFKKYIEREEINISYYGANYTDLVKEFCCKTQVNKLRKLLNFTIPKHKTHNLSESRLKCLNYMIQTRAKKFIDVINKKDA